MTCHTQQVAIIFIAIFIAVVLAPIALPIIVHIKSRHTSPLAIIHLLIIALPQRPIITHNRHNCLLLAAACWLAAFARGTISVRETDWQLCLLYSALAMVVMASLKS